MNHKEERKSESKRGQFSFKYCQSREPTPIKVLIDILLSFNKSVMRYINILIRQNCSDNHFLNNQKNNCCQALWSDT